MSHSIKHNRYYAEPPYQEDRDFSQTPWSFYDARQSNPPARRNSSPLNREPNKNTIDYVYGQRPTSQTRGFPAPIIIRERKSESFSNICKHYFIDEEISLSMNKLSLLTLLCGLMFLGTLFFVSGFLVAVNVNKSVQSAATHLASAAPDPLAKPDHLPTNNPNVNVAQGMPMGYTQGPQQGQPQYIVSPQYATVGGVAVVQQPRVPSTMQVNMVAPNPNLTAPQTAPVHRPSQDSQQQVAYQYPPLPPHAMPAHQQQAQPMNYQQQPGQAMPPGYQQRNNFE